MTHALSWLRVKARVRELAGEHACGEDRSAEIERLAAHCPERVEEVLAAMLGEVQGSARERLSRLAASLGFVGKWQRQARESGPEERRRAVARLGTLSEGPAASTLAEAMRDEDHAVRLEAARALLSGGIPRNVEEVFAAALAQPPAVRAELAQALRQHAALLAERALPEALASEDAGRIRAALEFIESWGRALPLPAIVPLLRHSQAGVRARALRAALYDRSLHPLEPEVLKALWDGPPEVRAAGCLAAARLRLETAVPAMLDCLRHGDPELAQAAANGLAEIGPAGLAALENEVRLAWEPRTAAAALAAVEQARTGRYGYVKLSS